MALANFKFGFSRVVDLAIQPDGKLVAVGRVWLEGNFGFAVARYNSDGSLDTGFGSLGLVINKFAGGFSCASNVSIQPDGFIVVIGEASGESSSELIRVCYDARVTLIPVLMPRDFVSVKCQALIVTGFSLACTRQAISTMVFWNVFTPVVNE